MRRSSTLKVVVVMSVWMLSVLMGGELKAQCVESSKDGRHLMIQGWRDSEPPTELFQVFELASLAKGQFEPIWEGESYGEEEEKELQNKRRSFGFGKKACMESSMPKGRAHGIEIKMEDDICMVSFKIDGKLRAKQEVGGVQVPSTFCTAQRNATWTWFFFEKHGTYLVVMYMNESSDESSYVEKGTNIHFFKAE